MNPTFSLLVPCYNAARFLPRLMADVNAMTEPFTEMLSYDDGSSDDTGAVARSLGLKVISGGPNRGVSYARNRLAAAARCEWIHFHDADDRISPQFVERLAPQCGARHDVVSCDADWIDESSHDLLIAWRYDPALLASDPHRYLIRQALSLNNSIIRRSAWERVGGCDESLAIWEDADIHIRLARAGARFYHVPEVLTWGLRRSGSFSHDYRRNWACRLMALEHYAADPQATAVATELADEAERAAGGLLTHGDRALAATALELALRLGGNPPTTGHRVLRLLKLVLPRLTALRLQLAFRRKKASL